jgi:hypothetical protein
LFCLSYTIDDYEHKYIISGQSLASLLKLSDPALWEALSTQEWTEKEDNLRHKRLLEQISSIIKDMKEPGVTRQLLWREYKSKDPEGYG